MNTDSNKAETWSPCAPGTLEAFGRASKAKRRLRVATRVTGSAVAVLLIAGLSVWSVNSLTKPREFYFGGIGCRDVRDNLGGFAMGTLPDELSQRIQAHLKECPACQEVMKRMDQPQASINDRPLTGCRCEDCQPLSFAPPPKLARTESLQQSSGNLTLTASLAP